jgi:hypothetical protein
MTSLTRPVRIVVTEPNRALPQSIRRCHRRDPGSIPGQVEHFSIVNYGSISNQISCNTNDEYRQTFIRTQGRESSMIIMRALLIATKFA